MRYERMNQQIVTHTGDPLRGRTKFAFDFDDELKLPVWARHCNIDLSHFASLHNMADNTLQKAPNWISQRAP